MHEPAIVDRHLDAELVSNLIAAQFPDLDGCEVRPLDAGWDNELYTVGGGWVFRFPKRAERVPWHDREIEIMRIVGEALGPTVPRFECLGEPSDGFPYPFVGYRRLPGVGADETESPDVGGLAEDVGGLLSRLHRVDPRPIPSTPAGWEHEPWSEIRADLVAMAGTVCPLLSEDLLIRAEPYLTGAVPEPPRKGPRRFIHNDICPDHVLVDRHTGRLRGLIDFADAMVGDPVLDFVGLIGIGGRPFVDQVVAHYDLPLGDAFHVELDWLSRVLTLTWLGEAAADDAEAVAKHLMWVDRAFGD